ncbi:alpha/beta hydrolase fold [Meinhardsimonia xiamenensis]|jgi:acetyl esterase/lipase|uniref:Alpha/beta hydrolase fold n=1 Tax=Meinhardsimonia xiamenensis TaxID=990712 RepID=A0A1G8Y8Z2_9RHOB|nr:alpha/beta hydrolase [Meinhardsimonia xiamenensis]PRX37193.1 alpha/beta hydrolase family protein [Meinhardsimonia xiamenensis]SDJ98695.1 alpha/beta hydrolase fold [Meinhardsimonia xiamenensis]
MDLSDDYENARYIPGAEGYPPRWEAEAAAFRASLGRRAELDIAYGAGERQRLDLFRPEEKARGLVVFVHGGYWRRFDKSLWSHLAAGSLAHGFAVAMPSYTLAPRARIRAITREVAASLEAAAERVPEGPLVVTGHSAGGHLSLRMACRDVALSADVTARMRRVVPISPLCDLRPLLKTVINDDLHLDADEAAAESPLLAQPRDEVETIVWVGAEERPVFLDQARWAAGGWPRARLRIAPGRHHFDVIDALAEPGSPMVADIVGGLA